MIAEMPSPVGHALGGIAAGCAISHTARRHQILLFALVGMLADIDFVLAITHRGPTHSLLAAATAFAAALIVLTPARPAAGTLRLAIAIGVAYLSHVLFDWLGEDGGPPAGIMVFWPFSTAYYVSGLDIFGGIERRYWQSDFWSRNLLSIVREVVLLTPPAMAAVVWSRRRERRARAEVQ
jgi:hypothetical protein